MLEHLGIWSHEPWRGGEGGSKLQSRRYKGGRMVIVHAKDGFVYKMQCWWRQRSDELLADDVKHLDMGMC